jgi:hypothetical protein
MSTIVVFASAYVFSKKDENFLYNSALFFLNQHQHFIDWFVCMLHHQLPIQLDSVLKSNTNLIVKPKIFGFRLTWVSVSVLFVSILFSFINPWLHLHN